MPYFFAHKYQRIKDQKSCILNKYQLKTLVINELKGVI